MAGGTIVTAERPKLKRPDDAPDITYNLYDRFINLELEQYWSIAEAENALRKQRMDSTYNNKLTAVDIDPDSWRKWVLENSPKFQIITPISGVKPDITVSAVFLPTHKTTQVTVTVKNLENELDISNFGFLTVSMGYSGSMQLAFRGPILNSYVESPNPNGKTVFQILDGGYISELLIPRDIVIKAETELSFLQILLKLCKSIIKVPLKSAIEITENEDGTVEWGGDWNGCYTEMPIMRRGEVKHFGSLQECLRWLENILKIKLMFYNEENHTNMPPLMLTNLTDGIYLGVIGDSIQGEMDLVKLDYITNASFTGGGIVVTAPWNPAIRPLGDFLIDPKYFRGRFNGAAVRKNQLLNTNTKGDTDKGAGIAPDGKYTCTQLQIDFGTYSGNVMKVTGVMHSMANDSEIAKGAVQKAKDVSLDGLGGVMPPPFFSPSGYAEGVRFEQKDKKFTPPSAAELDDDTYFKNYSSYVMKKGDTLASVFGKTIATWVLDEEIEWQRAGTKTYDLLYSSSDITWDYRGKDPDLEGLEIYYPDYLTLGNLWNPDEGKGIETRPDGNGNMVQDAWELLEKVLHKITVEIIPAQLTRGNARNDMERTTLSKILVYYAQLKDPDSERWLLKIKQEVTFEVGYGENEAKDSVPQLRSDLNRAFDKINDYLDLYAYMVENAQYRELFGTQETWDDYQNMLFENRKKTGSKAFFISGIFCAFCTMITQTYWWINNEFKDDQLCGFDYLNRESNSAAILKPKAGGGKMKLTVAFPDFSAFMEKDLIRYFMDMARELLGWCRFKWQYRHIADELASDLKSFEQLEEVL